MVQIFSWVPCSQIKRMIKLRGLSSRANYTGPDETQA
jgi:hypothetical protein